MMTSRSEKNLEIWESLEKTDPKYTKRFQRGGGFTGTATNATYIMRRLTETFGPCGVGWRFSIDDECYRSGNTLKSGDQCIVHIVRGHLEYRLGNEWYYTGPQFGQTTFVGENKYGTFTDEEAPKKSITDCLSKCAVQIGVAADVHMGLFDDNKYVNERTAEEREKTEKTERVRVQAPKADKPKAASESATPDVITSGMSMAFGREVRKAGEAQRLEEFDIEDRKHVWLKAHGIVDSLGNGSTLAILKPEFLKRKTDCVAFFSGGTCPCCDRDFDSLADSLRGTND